MLKIKLFLALSFIFLLSFQCCNSPKTEWEKSSVKDINTKTKNITVGLYPFTDFDSDLTALLINEIQEFYHFKAILLNGSNLPSFSYYPPRNRYRADSLLKFLKSKKPDNINYIIGLTKSDISTSHNGNVDWGIFGLGYMPGKACVISTYRLGRNEVSNAVFKDRLSKVILHELGHNIGLNHCKSEGCMMADAKGSIKTVDHENKMFCSKCKRFIRIKNKLIQNL